MTRLKLDYVQDRKRFVEKRYPKLRKLIKAQWEKIRETVTRGEVEKWLQASMPDPEWEKALRESWTKFGQVELQPFLSNTLYDAGNAMMDHIERATQKFIRFSWETKKFQSTTQRILAWLKLRSGTLITEITTDTLKSIRGILANGMKNELGSLAIQKRIMARIPLTSRESGWVDNYFERAIEAGVEARRASAMTDKYQEFLEKLRAERIARTETARAYSQGNDECFEQARESGIIKGFRRIWRAAGDACDACVDLDGQETDEEQPLHPNCGCTRDYEIEED